MGPTIGSHPAVLDTMLATLKMETERRQQIERLLSEARQRSPDERDAFLTQACGSDETMRQTIGALLDAGETQILTPNIAPGQAVGRYRILSLLGSGGMGDVWLAEDSMLDRKVAVKLLPPRLTRDGDSLQRFLREAKAASALNHPNILTVYEIGKAGELQFIATEFIDGITLRQKLEAGPIPFPEILEIIRQVSPALETAHSAGIVHRDIKPENIMIRPDGLTKVLDFELARFTERRPYD